MGFRSWHSPAPTVRCQVSPRSHGRAPAMRPVFRVLPVSSQSCSRVFENLIAPTTSTGHRLSQQVVYLGICILTWGIAPSLVSVLTHHYALFLNVLRDRVSMAPS
jgi:hypothetical protein